MPATTSTPVSTDTPLRSYTGYYHFRSSSILSLNFEFRGDLKGAIGRWQEHCNKFNYKFIKVRPLIVDLDEREKRHESGEYEERM